MRREMLAVALAQSVLVQAQVTGKQGDAQAVADNPQGAQYIANINKTDGVVAQIVAQTTKLGDGVYFQVNINSLPAEGGPFLYHIHDQPVPKDGNCTKTLAHLDPYIRGEDPPCDRVAPQSCQVGDLSGKHGKPHGSGFSAHFVDKYVSLKEGVGAFIGNRSIVVHKADKTRIGCANFVNVKGTDFGSNSTSSSSSVASSSISISNKPSSAIAIGSPSSGSGTGSATASASSGANTASAATSVGSGSVWGAIVGVVFGVVAITL